MKRFRKVIALSIALTVGCVLTVPPVTGTLESYATSKVRISKKNAIVTVGKTLRLKVKGTKKKVRWTSSKRKVATVTSSGLVYANRVGTATITARTKNGSARCKVTVKAAPDAVGSRTNPADPRNGVTIKKSFGTMYFKLNVVLRGEDAINKLKAMGEWSEYDQETYKQDHPGTTLTLFIYYVKAVDGYDKLPLTGYGIISPGSLYDGACKRSINSIDETGLYNAYESKDRSNLKLYHGAGSDMYMALYVPNKIREFSNELYDSELESYWIKYTF